jgi:hypothetical protein
MYSSNDLGAQKKDERETKVMYPPFSSFALLFLSFVTNVVAKRLSVEKCQSIVEEAKSR